MTRQRRNTIILALVLLAVLGAAFCIQRLWLSGDGAVAVVQAGDRVICRLPLSQDRELWVGDEESGRNLIRVKDGAVMVAEADCPDKICVRTGPIRQEGQIISCLPHKLSVYIPREEG